MVKLNEAIKQENFRDKRHKAHLNILYTANWLRDQFSPVFKKHGILSQHYNVLCIVRGKKEKAVTPGEIFEVMMDKGRDLTRLVDKLVTLGLLRRQSCPTNKRKIEIFITEKGQEVTSKIDEALEKLSSTISPLSNEEFESLSNLLDKIREQ